MKYRNPLVIQAAESDWAHVSVLGRRGGVKGTVTLSRSALREVVRGMTEEGII